MILFSDLHLKPESEQVALGEVLPGIRAACRRHDDKVVGFLGDWWHLRYAVDVRLQNAVRDELLRWQQDGIELIVLVGNHDQVDVAGRNAMEVFGDLPHVTVVSEPRWRDDGLWIPYRVRRQDIVAALLLPKPRASIPSVLFMHHGVRGAMMNSQVADTEGLELDLFQNFDTILCGHYHQRQQVGTKLHYVGSPWQTKADEIGQSKGYAVWNGGVLHYYDAAWGPRHYKVVVGSADQVVDLSMVRACDKVKIEITDAGVDAEKIARQVAAIGVLPVIEHNVEHHVEQRLGAAGSIEEYAVRYAEMFAQEQSLDAARLIGVFKELAQ